MKNLKYLLRYILETLAFISMLLSVYVFIWIAWAIMG